MLIFGFADSYNDAAINTNAVSSVEDIYRYESKYSIYA